MGSPASTAPRAGGGEGGGACGADPPHRKSPTRLMRQDLARRPRRRQRGPSYGHQLDLALRVIAESVDYVCAERLRPNLVWLADHLANHGGLGPAAPHPANRSLRDVPIRRIPWDEPRPGHFEVDLVHHCGLSASGQYVHTLQMVDVATGWSERAATLGRSYLAVQDAFRPILARLPFKVLEIHPHNDSTSF